MDPKQLEAKLEGDVEKAWAEIMAEKEDVKWRHASLESRWRQAEERLHSFRMQLVAGGAFPDQAPKGGPAQPPGKHGFRPFSLVDKVK